MLVHIPNLLSGEQVAHVRGVLSGTDWVDGKVTAGAQSAGAKHNLQVPENAPAARALGDMILTALGQNERFNSAALALRVFPPLFYRYDQGMNYSAQNNNAIRFVKGASQPIRVHTNKTTTQNQTKPNKKDNNKQKNKDMFG